MVRALPQCFHPSPVGYFFFSCTNTCPAADHLSSLKGAALRMRCVHSVKIKFSEEDAHRALSSLSTVEMALWGLGEASPSLLKAPTHDLHLDTLRIMTEGRKHRETCKETPIIHGSEKAVSIPQVTPPRLTAHCITFSSPAARELTWLALETRSCWFL